MIVFVIISIITLLSGVLYTFFWMFTLIKFMIVKYLYATIICKYDQRRNHGLVVYEYEIDANGQNIHVKGPQNINFNPLFHDQLNVGDKVRVKYDSKRNKILSKLGTILFYLLLGMTISLIGIIMFMFVRIMML
jgi:hypothetical protein